jgi:DNA-binding GntR family transcriptional regulator
VSQRRSNVVEPLAQESTASLVASRVREAIARGDIAPGSQLGEADYAAQLGVSRGPLREGLQRLSQEGLLVARRNRGLFVIEMDPETITDIYLAREAIERAAAAQIHAADPEPAAAALLGVMDDMAAAAAAGDVRGVSQADARFHQVLVDLAGSPRLTRIHGTLRIETQMCLRAMESTYTFDDARVGEHREIALSFRGADPLLTDRLLVAHMHDAIQRLGGSRHG